MLKLATYLASAAFTFLASSALAADVYPTRPIRMVDPFSPGGSTEAQLRALVPKLTMDPEDETTELIDIPKLPPRVIALAWHRDRYRTPAAHAFVETAEAVTAELEPEAVAA